MLRNPLIQMGVTLLVLALGLYGVLTWSRLPAQAAYCDDPFIYYARASFTLGQPILVSHQQWDLELTGTYPSHHQAIKFFYPRPQVPYRDYQMEYPPLALALFILPRLLTMRPDLYFLYFGALMLLATAAGAAVGVGLMRRCRPGLSYPVLWGAALFSAFVWCAGPMFLYRFDIVVAVAVAGAVLAVLYKKWLGAGMLLGFAIALKIWPVFLLPVLGLWALRHAGGRERAKALAGLAVFPVLSHAAVFPFAGFNTLNYFFYHGSRGLELESVWATLAVIYSRLAGLDLSTSVAFGSFQLHTAFDLTPLIVLSYAAMIATNAAVLWVLWRRRRDGGAMANPVPLVAAAAAATLAIPLSAKVFSAQYIFWLFPLCLACPGRRGRAMAVLCLLAMAATQQVYPWYFDDFWHVGNFSTGVLLARDGMLVATLVLAVWMIAKPPEAVPATGRTL